MCECECECVPLLSFSSSSVSPSLLSSNDALKHNQEIEFQRNKERFQFLKWGACAFRNMLIVPPGSGIVHQVHSHVMSILGHVM